MRVVLLTLGVLAAGCASPWEAASATLVVEDAARLKDNVAVRFALTNVREEGDLVVASDQLVVQSGTGFFTCTNRAYTWRALDVDPATDLSQPILVPPGHTLAGYVEVALCPDVAGPYSLEWLGGSKADRAPVVFAIHSLDARREADEPGISATVLLARERDEVDRLVPRG